MLVAILVGVVSSLVMGARHDVWRDIATAVTALAGMTFMVSVFGLVYRLARGRSVIVSDRGIELAASVGSNVIPWSDLAGVVIERSVEGTRLRFLTHDALLDAVDEVLASPDAPPEPGDGALFEAEQRVLDDLVRWGTVTRPVAPPRDRVAAEAWASLLERYAGRSYRGEVWREDGAGGR